MANSNKKRRWREIRDIHKKLTRKGYRSDRIMQFFHENYHIAAATVYHVLQQVDEVEVENPSIIYQKAMSDDFNL